MSVIVTVIGFDSATRLSSAATAAQGVTPMSCPTCPKTPTAYIGAGVASSVTLPPLAELRVLRFNTMAGAGLWRNAFASELADKVVFVDGDDT
jgi:hypothetical protein